MERRTRGIKVPSEDDAIGLFLSETEPAASRGPQPFLRSGLAAPDTFDVVPAGEPTMLAADWPPPLPSVGQNGLARVGIIRRGTRSVAQCVVFAIRLPFRTVAYVCASVTAAGRSTARGVGRLAAVSGNAVMTVARSLRRAVAIAVAAVVTVGYLPVRGAAFVTDHVRRGITRVHAWMAHTVRVAWAYALAVAYLPVRAARFVATQARLAVARSRAWLARTRDSMVAFATRVISSLGAWVEACRRTLVHCASMGWAHVVAVAYLPVRAARFVTTQVRQAVTRSRAWLARTRDSIVAFATRVISSLGAWVEACRRTLVHCASMGWAHVVAVAYLPVRAARSVTTQVRLAVTRSRAWLARTRDSIVALATRVASSVGAWAAACRRTLVHCASMGWTHFVAVACLPVRAAAFAAAQVRLGVDQARSWLAQTRHALLTAAANIAAASRAWVAESERALRHAARVGLALVIEVCDLLARAAAVTRGLWRTTLGTLTDLVDVADATVWRSVAATGHALHDGTAFALSSASSAEMWLKDGASSVHDGVQSVTQALQSSRGRIRRVGPALAGDAGLTWLLAASAITYFAIASWREPDPHVAPAVGARAAAADLGAATRPAVQAEHAVSLPANPAVEVAAVVEPLAPVREPATEVAPSYNQLNAGSVPMIWGGVDSRALQQRLTELSRQTMSFRGCEVSLVTSTRAKAVCTGVLRFVARVGNQKEQYRAASWTVDMQQQDDRWQIVKVAMR